MYFKQFCLITIAFCFLAGEDAKGVTVKEGYTGCVRNLVSSRPDGTNPQTLYLAKPLMMAGNLYLGGCPYNLSSEHIFL